MRKLIFTFLLLSCSFLLKAQTVVFSEDFETLPLTNVTTSGSHTWDINTRLQSSGLNSDSSFISSPGDVSYLTTGPIDCSFNFFVTLEFDNICKVEFFDSGTLEISIDGGVTWTQLRDDPTFSNCTYLGTGLFSNQTSRFQEASYTNWIPGMNVIPDNSWWHHEIFDISGIAGNNADVRLRWKLADGNNNGGDRNGWAVDNLLVTASFCELIPPVVYNIAPNYGGTVYNLGPFTINGTATDASGIASMTIFYTINTVAQPPISMANTVDSTYTGQIPAVAVGDTICYYLEAIDGSFCANVAYAPGPTTSNTICFDVQAGISLPYCDNFDITTNLWTSQTFGSLGSDWELGTPAYGVTSSAFSAPNSWDINLTGQYQPNANSALLGPELSNVPVGSTFSFKQNRNCEGSWDGVRLEWAIDAVNGPWTVVGTVQGSPTCVGCVNWYTNPMINSSGLAAWDGTSNGWIESKIILDATMGTNIPSVFYRFVFTSDASVQYDGFSIDNVCIVPPQPDDVGVSAIVQPGTSSPAGTCLPIIATVQNFGLNTQTTFPVYYILNPGGLTDSITYTGSLAPGATAQVTLPCAVIPPGAFNLCVFTGLTTDTFHDNDTVCVNSIGIPVLTLTSCDDFESGNNGWQDSTTNATAAKWFLGAPNYGVTTGAHSGTNAWDINLTGPYGVAGYASLTTPIYDLNNPTVAINPYLSFWRNQATAPNDGLRVLYEVNGNNTWIALGFVGDPNASNWYNNPSLNFSGIPGWDGVSNGWKESRYYLQALITSSGASYIRFRFEFTSGFNGAPTDGVSIDDFCVKQPGPNDVGVTAIIQPGLNSPAGTSSNIQVTIRNFGSASQTNIPVAYSSITGGLNGSDLYPGTLAPGATANFTFTNPFIVPPGLYDFCAYTQLVGDSDNSNDTTCINSIGIPVLTLTSCDDFENGNLGWQDSTTNTLNAQWQLGTPNFGVTTGAHSGTNAWDINLNSGYLVNSFASLTTPIYDLTLPTAAINPYLSFWRNQLTAANDGLRLMYEFDGNGIWTVLGTVADPNGYNWYTNASINFSLIPGWDGATGGWKESRYYLQSLLTANPGATYLRFRFEFVAGFNGVPNDGVSIDDFCVKQPGPNDVGVTAILQPFLNSPAGGTSNVQVTIRNFGSAAQSNIPISWNSVSAGLSGGPEFYPGPLAPGATANFTFTSTFTVPSGQFDFSAYTQLTGDSDNSNDTTTINPVGVPVIVVDYANPFNDNFDGVNVGWSTNVTGVPGTLWELGAPNYLSTSSAYSPPNAWDINLNSAYGNSAYCTLLSPIFDLTNGADPKLSFFINHNTEQAWDGVRMEYSLNGNPWIVLGPANPTTPCWTNWYSQPSIISSNLPAWAGVTGGWINVKADCLNFLSGALVQFRFIFTSDASVTYDGFSIDNFNLSIPVPLTASPLTVNTSAINTSFIFPGQQVQFSSPISNPGTTPLTSVNATITISQGGNPPIFTFTDPIAYSPALASQQNLQHVFSQLWTAAPGVYDVCVITSSPNNGVDQNPFDDTTCITISVFDSVTITSANPYCTDFESGPQWVSVNALTYNNTVGNEWELGTPSQTIMNNAHSGVKAWAIDLTGNYANRDTSGLFTPVFSVDNTKFYKISFWQKYDTEPFADGGTVEYSNDNAVTWQQLGFASSSPLWFNTPFITALGGTPGLPGWSGTEPNWIKSEKQLCFGQTGTAIFRFRFASDNTINNYEGWEIDDFCFEEIPGPCVVGLNEQPTASGLSLGQNFPNPFNGTTLIDYVLPKEGAVKITVTNLLGQEIAIPVDGHKGSGAHSVNVNSKAFAPGIYYYSLEFNGEKITKKMIIID